MDLLDTMNTSETETPKTDQPPAETDELLVPVWCSLLMEGGLWAAIAIGVLFAAVWGTAVASWICVLLTVLSACMWLLHWHFLQRPVLLENRHVWILTVGLAVTFLAAALWHRTIDASQVAAVLACLLAFATVANAFTETQVARLLAFLAGVGLVQVVVSLQLAAVDAWRTPIFGALAGLPGVVGTLGNEWAAAAVLLCAVISALTFAIRSLAMANRSWDQTVYRSKVTWLTSSGLNLAIVATVTTLLVLMLLSWAQSILVFPICLLAVVVFALAAGLKGKLPGYAVALVIVLCALMTLGNLGRPDGTGWGFSPTVLQMNVTHALAGRDARPRETETGDLEDATQSRPIRLDNGDLARAGGLTVWPMTLLVAAVAFCFIYNACQGITRFDENQPILAAGGLAAVLGVMLLALVGRCLGHIGVGLVISTIGAIAAAAGDFEEELLEE